MTRPAPLQAIAGRQALEAELLAWMGAGRPGEDDDRFDRLARALFAHQFSACPPYRRFCEGRGVVPEGLTDWRDIPAVPTGAFKEVPLRSFPAGRGVRTFRTSGTAAGRRGELHLDTTRLYEASLTASFERGLLPDVAPGQRVRMLVLAPSAAEQPDSSLSYMFDWMLRRRGDAESGWLVEGGVLRGDRAEQALEAAAACGGVVLICGTAFAFVHLMEEMERRGRRVQLGEGARLMETGGFKGRARERPAEALYAELEQRLAVPAHRVVNQYGMTELASQFYDSVLARPGEPRRKLVPPWVRVRVLDPESGDETVPGRAGQLAVVDLANTGSVIAVQTADLGRAVPGGFQVLGRAPEAEARGCSIAADEMLGAGA